MNLDSEIIFMLILNGSVAYIFMALNKRIYLSEVRNKSIWKVKFYATAFFFLLFIWSLPVVLLRGIGTSEDFNMIITILALPFIIFGYKKLLNSWKFK